jgi:hypothetical protein
MPTADNYLVAAKLCSLSGREEEARDIVTMGVARFPEQPELKTALG